MNAYRIKIGKSYRFGYKQDGSEHIHFTNSGYVGDQDAIELQHQKLKRLQLDYPDHTFWIEEYNPDNQTWSKLTKNSMYALFSEDEPEEEKPAKKKPAVDDNIWRFIPDTGTDTDIPF